MFYKNKMAIMLIWYYEILISNFYSNYKLVKETID